MVAKPGTDTIEPTFKLMMIRTNIAPSHDVAHCRLLLIRTALCRDWLRGFHHGNDVCGYIAAVPGGAFGNIITRLLKLASSTHEHAQCGRRQTVEILPRADEPACSQRRKLGSGAPCGLSTRSSGKFALNARSQTPERPGSAGRGLRRYLANCTRTFGATCPATHVRNRGKSR